jgi:acyl carrier protein
VFDDDAIVATPELTADEVDGWDSFSQLRVIFSVEERFGVKFAASEVSDLKNVGELADLVIMRLAG